MIIYIYISMYLHIYIYINLYISISICKPDELENNGAETWLTGIIEVL